MMEISPTFTLHIIYKHALKDDKSLCVMMCNLWWLVPYWLSKNTACTVMHTAVEETGRKRNTVVNKTLENSPSFFLACSQILYYGTTDTEHFSKF